MNSLHQASTARKSILVTGGTKGIGLAIAQKFAAEGFDATVCSSTQASIDAARLTDPGLDYFLCDVSDPAAVDRLAEHVARRHGALDVLVNNAGKYIPGQLFTDDDDALEAMLEANVKSAHRVCRRVLGPMIQAGRGHVFNMCSTASAMAYVNGGSYCVAKHAFLGYSKTLREEMKSKGVRVTSVLPGATLTASWDGTDLPAERFMPAQDVAAAVWCAHAMSERSVVEEILLRPMLGDLA